MRGRRLLLSLALLVVALTGAGTLGAKWHFAGVYPNLESSNFWSWKSRLAFQKNLILSAGWDLLFKEPVRRIWIGPYLMEAPPPDNPYSKSFLEMTGVRKVLGSEEGDLQALVRLQDWVHRSLLKNPIPGPPMGPDRTRLDLIWDAAQAGAEIVCGETSNFFAQVAAMLGYASRVISLSGTIAAEVYCQTCRKWVLFNPIYNVYYEKEGVPLNALDLHRIFFGDSPHSQGARAMPVGNVPGLPEARSPTQVYALIRVAFAQKGVEVKGEWGGPARLDVFGDLNPGVFGQLAMDLRTDYAINRYPIWHVRNQEHPWNYLAWRRFPPGNNFQLLDSVEPLYQAPR